MGVFQFIMGIVMCCVMCQQKNIGLRKCIYYAYIVYCVLLVLCLIAVVVLILLVDLDDGSERSRWEEDNEASIRGFLIAIVIIWAAIYIPITLVGLEVVYYGWKELLNKDDKKDKKKKE